MSEESIEKRNTVIKPLVSKDWWKEHEETNSQGILIGNVQGEFHYSHSFCGQQYYKSRIAVKRRSETTDIIPIIIPESVLKECEITKFHDKYVKVTGQICTYDLHDKLYSQEERHYLRICFAADSIVGVEQYQNFNNSIYLKGKICKEIFVKKLFSGDKVVQVMVRVIRKDGRRDYIPCVSWREEADYIEKNFKEGDEIRFLGRFRSRKYHKKDPQNPEKSETRTAYEFAITKII